MTSLVSKKEDTSHFITPDRKRKHEDDDPVVSFGKHRSSTYKDVFDADQSYCFFVLEQHEPSGGMLDFQQWLIPRVGTMKVQGPKHKGMEFERLRVLQPGYCDWVLQKEDATGWMNILQQYLKSKLDELWDKLDGEDKDEHEEDDGEEEGGDDEDEDGEEEEEEEEYDEEEGDEEEEFFY